MTTDKEFGAAFASLLGGASTDIHLNDREGARRFAALHGIGIPPAQASATDEDGLTAEDRAFLDGEPERKKAFERALAAAEKAPTPGPARAEALAETWRRIDERERAEALAKRVAEARAKGRK